MDATVIVVIVMIIANHGRATGETVSAFDLLRYLLPDFLTYSGCEVNRLVVLVSSDLFG
jgi:hypothetical protein